MPISDSLHCDLWHEKNAVLRSPVTDASAHELPGQQAVIAIVEIARNCCVPSSGIDLAGGEIQFPFFFVFRAIRQYQRYLLHPLFVQRAASCASSLSERLKRTHMGENWTIVVSRLLFASTSAPSENWKRPDMPLTGAAT